MIAKRIAAALKRKPFQVGERVRCLRSVTEPSRGTHAGFVKSRWRDGSEWQYKVVFDDGDGNDMIQIHHNLHPE